MSPFHMIQTIVIVSLLIRSSLSFPTSSSKTSISLSPRADDDDCFTTTFGITDFNSFSGSDSQAASVSFKTGIKGADGQVVCSRTGGNGSTSPFFSDPIPCNKTAPPNIFFSYPQDRLLRVYEVTDCGTADQNYLSYAEGNLPLFCYAIFGGQMCLTPTGYASLDVTRKEIVS